MLAATPYTHSRRHHHPGAPSAYMSPPLTLPQVYLVDEATKAKPADKPAPAQ